MMISRFSSIEPFFKKNEAFIFLWNLLITQIFYPLQSMAYTENLGLQDYAGFFRSGHK